MFITVRLRKVISFLGVLFAVLIFILAVLRFTGNASSDEGQRVPVVMYHHVAEDTSLLGKYVISTSELEADFKYLKDNGYTTLTVADLVEYHVSGTPLPDKCIVLTFDDGQESFYAYVYPLLQKYDMCAVINIVGSYVEKYSQINDHDIRYSCLTWEQVSEMQESGFVEIGNHTYALHNAKGTRVGCMICAGESLDSYSSVLKDDIGYLQLRMEEETGKSATTFAYPFGYVSIESVEILKNMGFQALMTCEEKINITDAEGEWLFNIGRFNRPSGVKSEEFFINTMGL